MKVTAIETLAASRLHERSDQWITDRYRSMKADACIVVIHADAGLTGIGEACAYGNPLLIADWVRWFAGSSALRHVWTMDRDGQRTDHD